MAIQQTRWYKGFYRETLVSLQHIFHFNWWSVMILLVSFFLPVLVLLHLFYSRAHGLNDFAFFIFFIFVAAAVTSIRGIIRSKKLRLIHSIWHPIFYFFLLLPSKMVAMADIFFQDEKKHCSSQFMKVCHVYFWTILGGGFVIGYDLIYHIAIEK